MCRARNYVFWPKKLLVFNLDNFGDLIYSTAPAPTSLSYSGAGEGVILQRHGGNEIVVLGEILLILYKRLQFALCKGGKNWDNGSKGKTFTFAGCVTP